jgi:hypothetical protein
MTAIGMPQDALPEIVRELRTPIETERADPNVAIAFAAGWHAADHSRPMLRADLARLRPTLEAAGQEVEHLEAAIGNGNTPQEVERLFGEQLMAADFRLGKAFMLASRIAALRPNGTFDRGAFAQALFDDHDRLQQWLQQLATALPPSAGHSVRDSLNMWANALTTCDDPPRPLPADQLDGLEPAVVHRQVEAWRTVLSGEKAGRDTLELTDYVGVAEGVAAQLRLVIRRVLKRFWPLVLTALLLIAAGIAAILLLNDEAGTTAGVATVLTTLGVTWKSLGSSLGRAVAKVEQPAWGAQVDRAIAFAITGALPAALIKNTGKKTLLRELEKWRKDHPRPADQGEPITAQTPLPAAGS